MKLIILDRDGVINQDSDAYVKTLDEFIPIPGSIEAIGRLCRDGWVVAVATNQSGIARGYYTEATLRAMHTRLAQWLVVEEGEVDFIAFCPHGPQDACDCRKPKPGLFHQIASHYGVELHGVPAVGDSLRDLQAATCVGAAPILVRTGKGERTLERGMGLEGVPVFADLAAVVDHLLEEESAC